MYILLAKVLCWISGKNIANTSMLIFKKNFDENTNQVKYYHITDGQFLFLLGFNVTNVAFNKLISRITTAIYHITSSNYLVSHDFASN